jgi:Trk K+ transport system NAD-binding subunit
MGPAFFLAIRRLRPPILLLVVVFAVGIAGLALIPGTAPDGGRWYLTIAEALYFMAYTATTIGFGEIPRAFNENQRLWVTAMIFASVIGWAYLIASLLALMQDRAFRAAVVTGRFRHEVHGLSTRFYLICGFGETGMLVAKALDHIGLRFALVDIDEARVQEAELLELRQSAPAIAADARLPENLIAAGLKRNECAGVLALTNDDQANLAVAMAVRLLHPGIPVLARAMSRETAANMASFGTDHILNPFATFGEYLALAIASPGSYRLMSWLTDLPGTTLEPETAPPRGHWIVCGYGRFGREVVKAFRSHGLDVTVVDPDEAPHDGLASVRGVGTEAGPLLAAGINESVGIVAGTDDDISNLSIAVTARELHPKLFTIVRQNLQANHELFDAFKADITMVSSEIIAHQCLALIHSPLLAPFLDVVRGESDAWADKVIARLEASIGERTPAIWSVTASAGGAPAVHRAILFEGRTITLGDLRRDPGNRETRLACEALYAMHKGKPLVLPADDMALEPGDRVLFAGRRSARTAQWQALRNLNVLEYVLTGTEAHGWLWRKLARSG